MSKFLLTDNMPDVKLIQKFFIISLLVFLISSCNNSKLNDKFRSIENNKAELTGIAINYPADGTIFPPEFPSPQFLWKDSLNSSAKWHIRFSTPQGKEILSAITESSSWRPDSADWQNIKKYQEKILFP